MTAQANILSRSDQSHGLDIYGLCEPLTPMFRHPRKQTINFQSLSTPA